MKLGRRALPVPRSTLIVLTVLVAALMVAPTLPGASGRSVAAVPTSGASPTALGASDVYAGSFAARAGYESGIVRSVEDTVPSVGPQLVVVTFYPSDPSFFVPPPLGSHPLTVAEIADRYGLSPAAYSSAESYFESQGLSLVHSSPDRLSLTVSGTAASVGRAFGTELESGTYDGRSVTFPEDPPSLPAWLESSVVSVTGLSSGFDTFSMPSGLPEDPLPAADTPAATPDLISPPTARLIYDLSSLYNVSGAPRYATGQGIVLLLWGDGYDPSDLATFFSNDYPAIFPQPTLRYYPVDGAPAPSGNAPSDPSKAPQELTLDIEWAGSMAPGATLDAVYAPDGPANEGYSPTVASMTDALNEAVTGISGVSVISMSFGSPENESTSLSDAWAVDLATATQEGITLLAATGDLGGDAGASCTEGPTVDFPAISPEVVAVGGTDPTLARNLLGQVTGIASESAWSLSGGGFSTVTPAPSWQEVGSAAVPISANGHRGIPDVSAAAAYDYLYFDGQNGVAAGTSFATPLWAGLVTEMDAVYGGKLGFVTPRLYAIGAGQESGRDLVGLADITTGSTCIGSATEGWDTETGWGSPRALLLYEDLTATFVNLTVSATPSPVAPGGTVTVVARLTNRTSGAPIVGVSIAVNLQASNSYGPCAGVWGSEDLTSNATGTVSLAVAVPSCYLGGHGTAQVSVTSDGYYGANSTSVAINLLGLFPSLVGIEEYPQNVVAFALIMGIGMAIGYAIGRPRRRSPPPSPTLGPPPSPAAPPTASLVPPGATGEIPPPVPSAPVVPNPPSPEEPSGSPPNPPAA